MKKMLAPNKVLGWRPDLPDFRDLLYEEFFSITSHMSSAAAPNGTTLVDLRRMCPPIYDQADTSSCTANAIAAILEIERAKKKLSDFTPSRLFIYYNERMIEGDTNSDNGAFIRDGIKSVASYGYTREENWPFQMKLLNQKPVAKAYTDAKNFKALKYYRLDNTNINSLKSCLADGFAFVAGITIYPSFEDGDTNGGVVPMPGKDEAPEGGHAIAIVGYDDAKKVFILRNSWGPDCGDKGYYYIPYVYLTNGNLTDDCWCIKDVT